MEDENKRLKERKASTREGNVRTWMECIRKSSQLIKYQVAGRIQTDGDLIILPGRNEQKVSSVSHMLIMHFDG